MKKKNQLLKNEIEKALDESAKALKDANKHLKEAEKQRLEVEAFIKDEWRKMTLNDGRRVLNDIKTIERLYNIPSYEILKFSPAVEKKVFSYCPDMLAVKETKDLILISVMAIGIAYDIPSSNPVKIAAEHRKSFFNTAKN